MPKIKLGDKVRDPLTGVEGIAYSRITYLQGCDRIGIQMPKVERKEDVPLIPNLWEVDEPQLVIMKKGVVACQKFPKEKESGGPSHWRER